MAALREAVAQEQRRQHALGSAGMTAFERHQQYMRDYVNFYNQGAYCSFRWLCVLP